MKDKRSVCLFACIHPRIQTPDDQTRFKNKQSNKHAKYSRRRKKAQINQLKQE